MEARTLLSDLQARGFILAVRADDLVIKPSRQLTDEDRAIIRGHKPGLLSLLTAQKTSDGHPEFADCNLRAPVARKAPSKTGLDRIQAIRSRICPDCGASLQTLRTTDGGEHLCQPCYTYFCGYDWLI